MVFTKGLLLVFGVLVVYVAADTPANCTYEDIRGVWQFEEGERSGNNDIGCDNFKGNLILWCSDFFVLFLYIYIFLYFL